MISFNQLICLILFNYTTKIINFRNEIKNFKCIIKNLFSLRIYKLQKRLVFSSVHRFLDPFPLPNVCSCANSFNLMLCKLVGCRFQLISRMWHIKEKMHNVSLCCCCMYTVVDQEEFSPNLRVPMRYYIDFLISI